ncbi:MAG: hypothetical protein HY303_07710 [Candidatus Wallbacteria bacterium]|nr:hypothetical protein [Candidatus Wallbacteria bacterium]
MTRVSISSVRILGGRAALGAAILLALCLASGAEARATRSSADTVSNRPLTRREAAALVERVVREIDKGKAAQSCAAPAATGSDPASVSDEVSRIKATLGQVSNDVSGVRDDLEFHLKKDRQEKEKRGRANFFGVAEFSFTATDNEASLSPILRFPYDWDQMPLAGVTAANLQGKRFFAVDLYKLGVTGSFGSKYSLTALMGWNPGAQANNTFANGFEIGSPTFQGEALFADVKAVCDDQLDMKVGYFWLPWGREVKGLLRLNPLFNGNSLYYKDGFSQAENQTGVFFQSHNKSRIQYGFGLTSGDKEFSLAGTQAFAHAGQFAWQRPPAPDNSRFGYYGSVQGKFNRFDWDLNHWDNGGEPGFFSWDGWTAGCTWGPHRRLTLMAELGTTDIVQSTGALATWDAWYATAVWKLFSDTDAALRYDYAVIDSATGTVRVTTERTLSVSHRLADRQTIIADVSNPVSNPGFNPASPVLNPGRDIRDDTFRVSYRLAF